MVSVNRENYQSTGKWPTYSEIYSYVRHSLLGQDALGLRLIWPIGESPAGETVVTITFLINPQACVTYSYLWKFRWYSEVFKKWGSQISHYQCVTYSYVMSHVFVTRVWGIRTNFSHVWRIRMCENYGSTQAASCTSSWKYFN